MSEPTLSELFLLGQALRVKPSSFVEGVELVMHGALHGVRARNGDGRSEPPATAPES